MENYKDLQRLLGKNTVRHSYKIRRDGVSD